MRKLFFLVTLLIAGNCFSQSFPTRDISFGKDGIATSISVTGFLGSARDFIVQADGKIVVLAWQDVGWGALLVARLNIDGSLDKTFGKNGYSLNQNSEGILAYNIKQFGDGKFLTVGNYT